MTKEEVEELVGEDAIFYDDLDSAIVGVADRCGMPTVVCYDRDKVIKCLVDSYSEVELDEDEIANGITEEQKKEEMAWEWYEFNVLGGYLGEYTPIFITINTF